MNHQLFTNQSPTIQRSAVYDSILALWRTQAGFTERLAAGDYNAGYTIGYQDALLAVLQSIGAGQEVERLRLLK